GNRSWRKEGERHLRGKSGSAAAGDRGGRVPGQPVKRPASYVCAAGADVAETPSCGGRRPPLDFPTTSNNRLPEFTQLAGGRRGQRSQPGDEKQHCESQ